MDITPRLVKILAGASKVGIDPFVAIKSLRRGVAPKTAMKLRTWLKVPTAELQNALQFSVAELHFIFTTANSGDVSGRYIAKAKEIFLNPELISTQPIHVRWRFKQ